MDTTTAQQPSETLGDAAEHYARTLYTALITAGTPGRVELGRYPADHPSAQGGLHHRWPFLLVRVNNSDVRTYVMPTSTGVVLIIETSGGVSRCLPTWGARAEAFGAATLAVARELTNRP